MQDLAFQGTVVAVAASRRHGFSKTTLREIRLVESQGVEGDAHAGAYVRHRCLARKRPQLPNLRQVHLIPSELLDTIRSKGYEVHPGELGENITTVGLALEHMPLGTRLRLGPSAVVELTGLRTPCLLIDRFKAGLKKLLVVPGGTGPPFRSGVMAVVRTGGPVSPGNAALAVLPDGVRMALPAL